ncbi:zinc-dependent alcohol dehydrogenase family protein [Caldimonas thermodepolymerans]|jgi:zinc-binding alcohol dehydrogenase family protein|uniref:Alcohol dehydrogenase n=1 Tax=Caldimonas thermodepolymerans TaxID=215580 RepID=A0A2S5T4R5_9BURK|nr:zinc-dependent alcohol dehydrogenase family protein [Caldimonas thermodepolymerans]PPE69942.1 alcohol dehydrogenase [Caldimonas thermodepolymerans]QPC31674.1 zinc-dependent alcohol dehydrogenase family protein [Caldimonas thermodepolymerans]RDH94870.1 propanol-preferring alcohol dehydrogenase [Caldimonas thermodepolymerans]TCP02777.1 propanol-preferring alcohol dehydrogenase [Caldimonas thermodepolymerans]UZG44456.1 zinc-dependent alcohol dehydrogenase family protein [Caldimonas thermodepol
MKAMVLHAPGQPLRLEERPDPVPGSGEVRLRVHACAVCRTDLHVVHGELPHPRLPLVPGHEIVGEVDALGPGVTGWRPGQRAGVPWLGQTCGHCRYCGAGRENLCDTPVFTGYTRDGGYATHVVAAADYCLPLDGLPEPDAARIAPLLCAGLIGYRSLRAAGDDAMDLGLYGFGAAAHLLAQVASHQGRRVHAFTRPGDRDGQAFARSLGAVWAGGSDERPPCELDAAILFAPVGELVPLALQAVRKGGRVVCGGIHMSDIPSFPYRLLWEERELVSVANLTRADGRDFLAAIAGMPLRVEVTRYQLERANEALADLAAGALQGAAVLIP